MTSGMSVCEENGWQLRSVQDINYKKGFVKGYARGFARSVAKKKAAEYACQYAAARPKDYEETYNLAFAALYRHAKVLGRKLALNWLLKENFNSVPEDLQPRIMFARKKQIAKWTKRALTSENLEGVFHQHYGLIKK